jgi:hypothetical protein
MGKNTCSECQFWQESDDSGDWMPDNKIGKCMNGRKPIVRRENDIACRHYNMIGIEDYPVDEKAKAEFLKKANEINAKPISIAEKEDLFAKLFIDGIIGICADYHTQKETL